MSVEPWLGDVAYKSRIFNPKTFPSFIVELQALGLIIFADNSIFVMFAQGKSFTHLETNSNNTKIRIFRGKISNFYEILTSWSN